MGYKRWQLSKEEWEKSGKKPLMFVMTESTDAADQITQRLNGDPIFQELNGRTINLHTNLKGRLRKRGHGVTAYYEFVESEREISDEDLDALRKLARELDENTSPYQCIVSVLMLREGWDVRNVTTIVPLRPLTAKSRILPEQTLGRGLRRMTPPGDGQPVETVTVVEHKAFASLYMEELAQEGLPIEIMDAERVPRTTVSVYPDWENKDPLALDLEIPRLSYGYRFETDLGEITLDELRAQFGDLPPIPLGKPQVREIRYEGRHLITNEILEQMKIKLPLLSDPIGAISFYREELERAVKVRGTHAKLAPLIERSIEEILFEEPVSLYDPRVVTRLGDSDVREYLRATFIPLLLRKITHHQERVPEREPALVSDWRPYQATHSQRHPVEIATYTAFNLVPCNRQLEVAMTQFLDRAPDVAAFARNQGPQCLRIDALSVEGRRTLYTPDFLIRTTDGKYILAETKGRVDRDVPGKARAAVEWCKAASAAGADWEYLYIPQASFEQFAGEGIKDLSRVCAPALRALLREASSDQLELPLELEPADRADSRVFRFIPSDELSALDLRARRGIEHAVMIYYFLSSKPGIGLAPVFQPLLGALDESAESIMLGRLLEKVPVDERAQVRFFSPPEIISNDRQRSFLAERARSLKRLLVYHSPIMPTGLLLFCLEYGPRDGRPLGGIFEAVWNEFEDLRSTDLAMRLKSVYDFRNTYIAHEKGTQLADSTIAEEALREWITLLSRLYAVGHAGNA